MLSIIAKEKPEGIAASCIGKPEITEVVACLLALKKVFVSCAEISEEAAADLMCKLLTDSRANEMIERL